MMPVGKRTSRRNSSASAHIKYASEETDVVMISVSKQDPWLENGPNK